MALSPWAFLPLHVFHAYPLSKSFGPLSYETSAIVITFVYNICLYMVENWTMTFPGFSSFWFDHGLSNFAFIQLVAFFYFSLQNASNGYDNNGKGSGKEKIILNGNKKRDIVWNWIYATSIIFAVSVTMDWGVPKEKMEDPVTTDGFHSIAHFMVHCFLFVMVWHVSMAVDGKASLGCTREVWEKL